MIRRALPPVLLAALAISLYVLFPYNLAFVTRILIMTVLVLSIDLVLGYAGIPTLGQAAMYGSGAYATALFSIHVWGEPVAGLMIGALAGGGVALVTGLLLMRSHGLTLIMLTIAVAAICHEVVNRARGLTGGADGLRVGGDPVLGVFEFDFIGVTGYWYSLSVAAVIFALLTMITRSPFGLSLKGIRESPARMAAIGAPVYWRRVTAYAIGGAVAGVAGALAVQVTQLASLEAFAFSLSAEALIMLVLGGAGRLYGAVAGTVLFMMAQHLAAANDPFNWLFIIGAMVLAIVFFLPGGLITVPDLVAGLFPRRRP